MQEDLRSLIKRIIENIDVERLDKRIVSYTDYKTKFVVPKPKVIVEIEMTDGKIAKIDVTDYFEGVIK